LRIVSIAKYTTPYSENQISSEKEILYALEVNAGFSDRNGVEIGNLITFERTEKQVM
jgi:uncharacterized protein